MTRHQAFNFFKALFLGLFGLLFTALGLWVLFVENNSWMFRMVALLSFALTLGTVLRWLPIELDHPIERETKQSNAGLIGLGIAAGPVVGMVLASRLSSIDLSWQILMFLSFGAFLLGLGLKLAVVNAIQVRRGTPQVR